MAAERRSEALAGTGKGERTVLVVLPMGNGMAQAVLTGVRGSAAARRWRIFSVETERMADGTARIERSSESAVSVGELASLVRPDGVIVWSYALSPEEVADKIGAVPTLFVNPPFDDAAARRHKFAVVRGDAKAVASLAARELLYRDFADLAFVAAVEDETWNRARGEAFRRCAEVAGTRCHAFNPQCGMHGWRGGARSRATLGASRGEALRRWLAALPKPCGLFAANDKTGDEVLGACAALGVAVPQDVSVVGVDNMVYLCEGTSPTLSSIVMDHTGEGRAATELLDAWMEAPRRAPPSPRTVPPLRVVRRASSRAPCDRRVARALEFIRLHAREDGFSPRAVVANMGVSRSLAFDLFRRVVGRTILDEIQSVRLECAKEQLAVGHRPDLVAADCGFASHDDFRRVFRKRCGMSVKAWKATIK